MGWNRGNDVDWVNISGMPQPDILSGNTTLHCLIETRKELFFDCCIEPDGSLKYQLYLLRTNQGKEK